MPASKIVLIDRDGVINRDRHDYVREPAQLEIFPAALRGIEKLTSAGWRISIVSNQAGVAKGLFSEKTLEDITAVLLAKIKAEGGQIASVHYCPHRSSDNCSCRKPKTGLLEQATAGLDVDRKHVFFVGDSERDVEAGKRFGCQTVLVLCGQTKSEEEAAGFSFKPDIIAADLDDAAMRIIKTNAKSRR